MKPKKEKVKFRPRGAGYAPHIEFMKYTAKIVLAYKDGSKMTFEVTMEGKEHDIIASLLMITRGTLMASMARISTCYKPDGTKLCVYTK